MIDATKSDTRSLRLVLAAAAVLLIVTASGETPGDGERAEFRFTRLQYVDSGLDYGFGGFGRGSSWRVDYPEAEIHFRQAVERLTRVEFGEPGIVHLRDDTLFDYPWLYAVEVGHWYLDDIEAAKLREYLLRGGFLMVDDFHGTREWRGFVESMSRVFPDRSIVEIGEDDEVMHVLYDVDQLTQIPGVAALYRGRTYEQDGYTPHWRGIYDDEGRLMVAINFNMDLGDAWEHADDPGYPEPMTALSYRFAVNYVIYAMTH
ncbi:MAG TPA: DUF4159 domain-containing protein [Gammaproteobacteria bacterium]